MCAPLFRLLGSNAAPAPFNIFLRGFSNGNEMYGIQRAVWTDEWKYVFNGFDYDELYDLRNDPLEMHNRINAPENAHIVKDMCMRMWSFARAHRDACTCPYIMVGFAPYGPGITIKD